MTYQLVHRGDETLNAVTRDLLEAWLTDEEVLVEIIGRFPWTEASETWVSGQRRMLQQSGSPVPADRDLKRLRAF